MKKIFFFDIDGTLLPERRNGGNGKPLPSTIRALKKLQANGHLIAIATGRPRFMLNQVISDLDIKFDYLVASNGQIVFDKNDTIIYSDPLTISESEALINWAFEHDVLLGFQSANQKGYVTGASADNLAIVDQIPEHRNYIVDDNFHHRQPVYQGIVIAPEPKRSELILDIPGLRLIPWYSYGIDALRVDSHKAKGVAQAVTNAGMEMQDAIGVGDGLNDLEMLLEVGTAILMGNSHQELFDTIMSAKKAYSHNELIGSYVIAKQTNDDPIEEILTRLNFI